MICYNFMLSATMQTFFWENSHNQCQYRHRMFSLFKSMLSYFHTGIEKDKKKTTQIWSCTLTTLTHAYNRLMIFSIWTDGRAASGIPMEWQCQVELPGFLLVEALGYVHNNSGALIPAEAVMLLPSSPLCDTVILTVIFSLLMKIEVITLDE